MEQGSGKSGMDGRRMRRSRRTFLLHAALAAGMALVVLALTPLDPILAEPMQRLGTHVRGDFRRELNVVQQFGGITSLVVIGIVILRLDRRRPSPVWDMVFASAATGVISFAAKVLIGRTRPVFDDHNQLLGTTNSMATTKSPEPVFTWELWERGVSQLWSMPSSHTSAAFALATFLSLTYPRIRWMVFVLAVLVGMNRVMTGAHWPTDVVGGAFVGFWVGLVVVRGELGRGLSVRLWRGRAGGGRGG